MTRRTFLGFSLLTIRSIASAEIAVPRIGFVRTRSGDVRALRGVAGNFTVNEVVLSGVDALWFGGTYGYARIADKQVTISERGEITAETTNPLPGAGAYVDEDEVVVEATGWRVRLPFKVHSVERAGEEYAALSGEAGMLLLRLAPEREALYEVPEAAE